MSGLRMYKYFYLDFKSVCYQRLNFSFLPNQLFSTFIFISSITLSTISAIFSFTALFSCSILSSSFIFFTSSLSGFLFLLGLNVNGLGPSIHTPPWHFLTCLYQMGCELKLSRPHLGHAVGPSLWAKRRWYFKSRWRLYCMWHSSHRKGIEKPLCANRKQKNMPCRSLLCCGLAIKLLFSLFLIEVSYSHFDFLLTFNHGYIYWENRTKI